MKSKDEYTLLDQSQRRYLTESRRSIDCYVLRIRTPYPAFDFYDDDLAEMVTADLGSIFGELKRQPLSVEDHKAKTRTKKDDKLCYVHNVFKVEYKRNYQSKSWEVAIWMHEPFLGNL